MKPTASKFKIPKASRLECRKRRAQKHAKQVAQYKQQERELRQEART